MKIYFKGKILRLVRKPCPLPDGRSTMLEVVEHPGAVLIVPFIKKETIVLLRQFRPTIQRYLTLLEKSFVVKRLYTLRRNRRDEIRSNFKVYFYDLGVRNYIINVFNPIDVRTDVGALFENYLIMERMKFHYNHAGHLPNLYFWRTHGQLEIDYIEEKDGTLTAFECKWGKARASFKEFLSSYPGSKTEVVHRGNIHEWLWPAEEKVNYSFEHSPDL